MYIARTSRGWPHKHILRVFTDKYKGRKHVDLKVNFKFEDNGFFLLAMPYTNYFKEEIEFYDNQDA